jgi:hypothetical protein
MIHTWSIVGGAITPEKPVADRLHEMADHRLVDLVGTLGSRSRGEALEGLQPL